MIDEIQSWKRQDGEPNRWHQRFQNFRLQGPGRSIEKTWATDAKHSKAKRPSSRWYAIVKIWNWMERAADWDRYLSGQKEADFIAHHMGSNEVLQRLADIARGDIGDFLDIASMSYNIDLEKAKELDLTHLIHKVRERTVMTSNKQGEETETHTIEIELYDSHAALVDLGKYHKLFTDSTELKLPDGFEIPVRVYVPENNREKNDNGS